MQNDNWKAFFEICARVLGAGSRNAADSISWCAWTTFGSLSTEITYWSSGLPSMSDIENDFIADNGVWGQPFLFADIAHLIIPKEFFWQKNEPGKYENGIKTQDILRLSEELTASGISHRLTAIILEIKLY